MNSSTTRTAATSAESHLVNSTSTRIYLKPKRIDRFIIISARQHMLSALYAIARPSVCLSVRPSHGWISRKRLNLVSCNFHRTVAPSLSFLRRKFHPEIPTGSHRAGASNNGGLRPCGKQSIFVVRTLSLGGYAS